MITAVRGRVRQVSATGLTLQVGPVDVQIFVPASLANTVEAGTELELFTHLALRPDQITLYGLPSRTALELFELLLGVNGVGPKMALSVLSAFDPIDLSEIISHGDTQALARPPGVGPRAANRIVSELGAKLKGLAPIPASDGSGSYRQALAALIDLGYALNEARQALESAPRDGSLEEMIRSALGVLADQPGR